ncbi:MAG TPA: aquaporin [Thermoanaerobaculia bacterium]|nr:aquaporin [Thermoanaerobaculia bacterium]
MRDALRARWPELLIEGTLLGLFMISASTFGVLLAHPASALHAALPDAGVRRVLGGLAMGATAVALIYSPWGKRSGAHMNPAVTLTFFRLGKVRGWDAALYVAAQFLGGLAGMGVAAVLLKEKVADPAVHWVVTAPGMRGAAIAFVAELCISFLLMSVVLAASGRARLARFTGAFCGALVALFIAFEEPFSGMSMNPARTFASAVPATDFTALWVYFTAPPLGMLLAVEARRAAGTASEALCARLSPHGRSRCPFCGGNG